MRSVPILLALKRNPYTHSTTPPAPAPLLLLLLFELLLPPLPPAFELDNEDVDCDDDCDVAALFAAAAESSRLVDVEVAPATRLFALMVLASELVVV